MKTLPELITWLKTSDKVVVVLVEVPNVLVEGSATTFYLSNVPYTDPQTNTYYIPCITGGVNFSESLSLDMTSPPSINYGDLELSNIDGAKDTWLTYTWSLRDITILIGDISWNRSDFRPIFTGVISDIVSRNLTAINIVLLDTLQKLNKPISTTTITSANLSNTSTLVPVTFGECFNISPISTNNIPASLEFQVHNGAIEDIIEVRDNGAPVGFTKNLAQGKFTLTQAKFGQITCSVQGHTTGTYSSNAVDVIKSILTYAGITLTIDSTTFNNISAQNPYPVGVYSTSGENILDICHNIARSIGCRLVYSPTGVLKLIKLDPTASNGASYTIGIEDIEKNSLAISDRPLLQGATKLGYCKNWTVQNSGLAGGLPESSVAQFKTEWLYSYNKNEASLAQNLTPEEAPQEDTLLLTSAGASAESARRTNLRSVARYVYNVKCYAHMLPVELGDSVTLVQGRFGLSSGKTGIVVSVSREWLNGRVTIGVLV